MNSEKAVLRVATILLILIAGVLGYAFLKTPTGNAYVYTGPGGEFNIQKENIGGITFHKLTAFANYNDQEQREYELYFRHGPEEVKDIEVPENIQKQFLKYTLKGAGMYITVDPEEDPMVVVAGVELARIIGQGDSGIYKIKTQGAITSETEKTNSTPIITCEDTRRRYGVIYIKVGDETRVYNDAKGCIIIEGETPEDTIKAADKVNYVLLEVLE